jgi:hypothetical protein
VRDPGRDLLTWVNAQTSEGDDAPAVTTTLLFSLGNATFVRVRQRNPQRMPIWKADVVPARPVSALPSVLRRGQAPRATGQDPLRPG